MKILKFNSYLLKESVYPIDTPYNYEWVKTTTLWKYREFDRSEYQYKIQKYRDILSQEGFNQPLILHYSHKYKTCYLTEGNHRLLSAMQEGIQYVPVRVTIDGVERKDAHKVVGFYSDAEKVDPPLPSQIGIPDCLDKHGKPVISETREIEPEEVELDYDKILSQYPDIDHFEKVEEGCYNIWVKMKGWWSIHEFMKSETFDNLDFVVSDDSENFFKHNIHKSNLTEYMRGDYFTPEMRTFLGLKADINYEQEFDYFWDNFTETPYYEKYLTEIKRILWEKYKEKNLEDIKYMYYDTPYDGVIEWWHEKNANFGSLHHVKGIVIKHELVECYEKELFEYKTFAEVLKKAYNKEIGSEWKIENYLGKITPDMLNLKNIFN